MATYIALLHKDADSDYGVSFPDFLGCVSAGRTMDEARLMAVEALTFHIEGMLEDGDDIPEPSTMDAIAADPENKDVVAFILVEVPDINVPPQRVNVTLPASDLRLIDSYVAKHGLTRSGFLVDAARKVMSYDTKSGQRSNLRTKTTAKKARRA